MFDDPIIIDLTGTGYQLTSIRMGVSFDFLGNGKPAQMSWTAGNWKGGFLALDRNGNGRIDDGTELFGNVTPQLAPSTGQTRNGFRALAVYDQPEHGGNGDGWIDKNDAIYASLLVWVDTNHNGVSEPGELLSLQKAGIQRISLNYNLSQWTDAYGNTFRYRAPIVAAVPSDQAAYDVLLQQLGPNKAAAAVTKAR